MKRLVTIILIGALPIGLMAESTEELKSRFSLKSKRSASASIFHKAEARCMAAGLESQRQAEGSKEVLSPEVFFSHSPIMEASIEIRHSDPPSRPPINPACVAGEFAVSSLLGAGVFLGAFWLGEDGDEEYLALLVLAGYPTVVAASVYMMGSLGKQTGSFGSALVGSLMGTGLVLGMALSSAYISPYIAAGIAPLVSTLAFNLTRRHKSLPQSNPALVNVKDGKPAIGVPALCILPSPYKPRNVDISVTLLSLELK